MDLLKYDEAEAASATWLEKPAFWMSRLIVSRGEALATLDPYETSICEVGLADSTVL